LFVTGTDTGVGKTLIACGLLRAAVARGLRAVGMKPVAAGAERVGDAWVNEDVTALREAGNVAAAASQVNPYCFAPPIAPHIAAAEAGVAIELDAIVRAYRALTDRADLVVVEGAGGYLVPLGENLDMAALAAALGVPVVLVVGMRLGCINHALLTAHAIKARGSVLAGWVANHVDPHMYRADENVDAIASRIGAPLLGRVKYAAEPHVIASAIDLGTLLAGTGHVR
ncbi:MAG: dethiobiotin synthase, partial [Rhodospirillaceae bacterium]